MITTEYIVGAADNHSAARNPHISIAIVADLHEFNPKPVLEILASIRPDVIAVPGDLFENHEFGENLDKEDDSLISRLLCRIIRITNRLAGLRWRQKNHCCKQNVYDFLLEASKIAPVVMSLGNHELYLTEEDKAVLAAAKVTLLNNSSVEIKNVLFGGIPSKQITGEMDTEFLRSFSDLPGYKVLLCHHPEYYAMLQQYPIDLFISGHCHGGQIRVRGRGIFAPGQGLLPHYHHGVYDGRLVVSSGCANTASIPRWGNETEVVVVRVGKTYSSPSADI